MIDVIEDFTLSDVDYGMIIWTFPNMLTCHHIENVGIVIYERVGSWNSEKPNLSMFEDSLTSFLISLRTGSNQGNNLD